MNKSQSNTVHLGDAHQIFISYCHVDIQFALQLKDELERYGYIAWLDTTSIPGGDIWLEQISQAIDEAFAMISIILQECVQYISDLQRTDLPESVNDQILLLLDYLRQRRCLIVLDNIETIMQAGDRAGEYRQGYEAYGRLFELVGREKHQSCLLLTSREKPKDIAYLEGGASPVRLGAIEEDVPKTP